MFDKLKNLFSANQEVKSAGVTLTDPGAASLFFGGHETSSGANVSVETAMRVPAVYAAVKVIAESVAQLPLALYRHLPNGGKEPAKDHPLYDLLSAAPNGFTTSFEWRLACQSDLSAYGNSYSYISRDSSGQIVELIHLHPNQVAVEINLATSEPLYRVTDISGSQNIFQRSEIFHLRTMGVGQLSSWVGSSPILQAREAIGLAMQLEEHAGRLFSNSARPGGLFKYGKTLSGPILERLREQLARQHSGATASGKTMILEDGMDFTPLQFKSTDSQFLELRQFAIQEIARILRVPLHLLGDLSRSTNSNIEQSARDYVQLCLLPQLRTWEDAISLSLLTAEERKTYFAAFNVDGFQRANIGERYDAYVKGINAGLISANEARAIENLPSYEGGSEFLRPLNMAQAAPTAPTAPSADDIRVWGA